MSTGVDAVVVGSGPNGMAAAVTLARAGLSVEVFEAQSTIGGGARTLDLGLAPGVTHDICSAVHPLAIASPFFVDFDLRARGMELTTPEVSYAQPSTPSPPRWRSTISTKRSTASARRDRNGDVSSPLCSIVSMTRSGSPSVTSVPCRRHCAIFPESRTS